MAGHSHAKNVKRTKEADAKKRSLAFAKIARNISILTKRGGGDTNSNPALRTMIEKSKEINVPKENIEKAIKKGIGKSEWSGNLEEFLFEGYGPGGIAVIVEGLTNNRNRSIAEFKKIMGRYGGKVAEPGSVKWMFNQKGWLIVECDNCNQAESIAIEMGAEEIGKIEGGLEIIAEAEDANKIKRGLENAGFKTELSLKWIPSSLIVISKNDRKKVDLLFEELNSNEDIEKTYSNIGE